MVLSEAVRHKIFLMEEAINFPASLLPHPNYKWENVPMVPYSDLRGAVNSLVEKGRSITSGISNWAGYALLAGLALAKGRPDILERVTPEQEGKVLDYLIYHGPAVDGITYKQDYSVDGIDFSAYMKVIERLKEIAFE